MNKWLIPWLSVALLAACSSEEPGPKTDDKLRTRGGFCDAWADAACNDDAVANCDSTHSACLEHQSTYCLNLVPTGYNSLNAEVCIDAVERAYRDAELTAEELKLVQRLEAECSRLVDGGRVEGEDCTLSEQCNTVQDFTCVIKVGTAVGSCQIPTIVGGGASCDDPEVICDEGFYCNGDNCIASDFDPNDDEVVNCSYDPECTPGGFCEIEGDETVGVCVPRLASGSTANCARDEQCESDFCLLTATTPKCTSRVILTSESSVCTYL